MTNTFPRSAPAGPSWKAETIAEHVHTLATLHMLGQQTKDQPGHNALQISWTDCMDDLYTKINAQGLRSVTTTTHTATLMADLSVQVARREDV